MWEWLKSLDGGAANFIGSLTGAAVGLIAIVIGALFNAHLNRRRDERLLNADKVALVAAFKAELGGLRTTLAENADDLEKKTIAADEGFLLPDVSHSIRLAPQLFPRSGLLDAETIQDLIGTYITLEQYTEKLLLIGCKLDPTAIPPRRLIFVPASKKKYVIALNRALSNRIDSTQKRLDSAVAT